ncbi:MAG TPA: DinB family protein [Pyrinomonadaceae bacterium]|nr:DinB family protein [Pyrinomonadaceae bacterium]
MNTVEHLRHLFAYNDWANRRIIVALKNSPSEKSRKILAHLLVTEQEYFARLYGKDSTGFDFWQNLTLEDCGALARETSEKYEQLLRGFDDEGLDIRAAYKTSEGVAYENTYRELLTHVLFHSSIHRGNIILKLREEGFTPPKIDYIIYLRETKYI